MKRDVKRAVALPRPKTPDFLNSELAQATLKALYSDIDASFKGFAEHIEAALPGADFALQRASVLFQMNESVMRARQEAIISAAGLALAEKKNENDRSLAWANQRAEN
ncbi:MAG: hypothetical protein GWN87_25005 [Desulfuromonadales bacterium]|nr:hypothetical protein [Desulfuromonadales bacterium]